MLADVVQFNSAFYNAKLLPTCTRGKILLLLGICDKFPCPALLSARHGVASLGEAVKNQRLVG